MVMLLQIGIQFATRLVRLAYPAHGGHFKHAFNHRGVCVAQTVCETEKVAIVDALQQAG